jgi:formate dehydrogenase major subunit
LVPLDSTAIGSNCPTSKSVIVRLVTPSGREPGGDASAGGAVGSDAGHRSDVEPFHLS